MKIFTNNFKSHLAFICISLFLLSPTTVIYAGPGNTIHVQTFTFGSAQTGWFVFPGDTNHYRKILLNYKLKCPSNGVCGEWDYLTYVYLTSIRILTTPRSIGRPAIQWVAAALIHCLTCSTLHIHISLHITQL